VHGDEDGRSGEIRTPDPLLPKQVVYRNSQSFQCLFMTIGAGLFVLGSRVSARILPAVLPRAQFLNDYEQRKHDDENKQVASSRTLSPGPQCPQKQTSDC